MAESQARGSSVGIVVMSIITAALLIGGGGVWYVDYEGRHRFRVPEARSNLKSMFTAEKAFYQEKDRYSASLLEIGFEPERGNRYAYFAADTGTQQARTTAANAKLLPGDTSVGVDLFKRPEAFAITRAMLPATFAGGVTLGVKGTCPVCQITTACAANVDEDPTLDVWSVSTERRTGPKGEAIAPGEPFQEVDDLAE